MYIARFKCDGKLRCDSVYNHCNNVKRLCKEFAQKQNLTNVASLCGLLHDMGKYSDDFQNYINEAINQTKLGNYDEWINSVKKTDHAAYGAKYIWGKFKNKGPLEKVTSEIIGEIICYHHGGLPDNSKDFLSVFIDRIEKINEKMLIKVSKIFEEHNKDFDIEGVFKLACDEINQVLNKLKKPKFELSLFVKNIYSMLVDADRFDSYLFEIDDTNTDKICDWDNYIQKLNSKLDSFKNANEDNLTELELIVKKTRAKCKCCFCIIR